MTSPLCPFSISHPLNLKKWWFFVLTRRQLSPTLELANFSFHFFTALPVGLKIPCGSHSFSHPGASHVVEFPEDADMRPPRGGFSSLEAHEQRSLPSGGSTDEDIEVTRKEAPMQRTKFVCQMLIRATLLFLNLSGDRQLRRFSVLRE